jgi:hypothetical protein
VNIEAFEHITYLEGLIIDNEELAELLSCVEEDEKIQALVYLLVFGAKLFRQLDVPSSKRPLLSRMKELDRLMDVTRPEKNFHEFLNSMKLPGWNKHAQKMAWIVHELQSLGTLLIARNKLESQHLAKAFEYLNALQKGEFWPMHQLLKKDGEAA